MQSHRSIAEYNEESYYYIIQHLYIFAYYIILYEFKNFESV